MLIVVSGVLAHWLIVPAAMREAYFGRWLPLVNYGYGAYNVTLEKVAQTILESPISLAAAAGALTAVMVGRRRHARLRQHLIALAALAGMALILIFLQKKGWSCHRVPLNVAGLLCLAMLVIEGAGHWAVGRRPGVSLGQWIVGSLVLGVILVVWFMVRWDARKPSPELVALQRIVAEHSAPGDRVLVVAASVSPAYPLLVQTDRRPGSRFLYAFPIACLYADAPSTEAGRFIYRIRSESPAEEQQFLDELEEDAIRRRPQLIIVQDSSESVALPGGFNIFDYLVASGWAQKVLGPYHELSGPEGWMVFERPEEK